jgi:hypothetical protein
MVGCAVTLASWEGKIGGSRPLLKKVRPYLQNNQSKKGRAGGVTQVAKHLPRKYRPGFKTKQNKTKKSKQNSSFLVQI